MKAGAPHLLPRSFKPLYLLPPMAETDTSVLEPQAEATLDIGQLLANIGPQVDALEIREYGTSRWVAEFDEDLGVELEYDADFDKLVLTAELGHPASGEETAAYKLLLQVSALWRDTGGLRMGLNPGDDTVVQIIDLPVSGLNEENLEVALRNFAQSALQARRLLAGSVNPAEADDAGDLQHFVRV